MRLTLCETDKYYYDSEKAERAVAFIEGYLLHYEDRFAGQAFRLFEWQKVTVLDLFGWRLKKGGQRRFKELWLEIAKGNGKTPLLAAIGLVMLLADSEKGAQIWSVATDYKQAYLTFDAARKFIKCSPKLQALVEAGKIEVKQYTIEVPGTNSFWGIMSGSAEGKHGFKPTCVCADEIHEWGNRKLYDNMSANMLKRSNPLMLMATNAGNSRESIAYELHERALRVLEDPTIDETLYPVIFTAPKDCALDDVEALKAANPSLGECVSVDNLMNEARKAKGNHALGARFRRYFLSQWLVGGGDRWLDMAVYDRCATGFSTVNLLKVPLYIGVDLSSVDDLTAIGLVWMDGNRVYAKTKQWIPMQTAFRYEDMYSIPYKQWEIDKAINIISGPTVGPKEKRSIAKFIVKLSQKYNLRAVCYDPWRSRSFTAYLESKGVTCIPVEQSFKGLSEGSAEFQRLLLADSIRLSTDLCLRWQASNVDIITDKMGNIRPVKPGQNKKYRGSIHLKIDSVMAILNALSVAIKDAAQPVKQTYSGEILIYV